MVEIKLPFGNVISENSSPFVIAEAGINHEGDMDLAHQLIDKASEAGANAVKFQTFDVDNLLSDDSPMADYQKANSPDEESQKAMLKRSQLTFDQHVALKEHCDSKGILFLSSPFDLGSVDLLTKLGVSAFKIPSGEITNMQLVEKIAKTNLPIILSTGMSNLEEVRRAVKLIEKVGDSKYVLLHCVSAYPTPFEDANILAVNTLREEFGGLVGLSDHTLGIDVPIASIALKACLVEKHFTLDKSLPGPDHKASLDPTELTNMVNGIHRVYKAMGSGRKVVQHSEANTADIARKSIFASVDIAVGEFLDEGMVKCLRPGTGIPSEKLGELIGKKLTKEVKSGDMLNASMFGE